MNCLYLAEDYIGSQVHHQLCQALSQKKDISMTVFAVQRQDREARDLTDRYIQKGYQVQVAPLTSSHAAYKYIFPHKIRVKKKLLTRLQDLSKFDLIHAATLFSEGALALSLHREYKIPYIVAVRGSDINFYFKKMPHLWRLGKEILVNAQKVIFISPNSQEKLFQIKNIRAIVPEIKQKSVIIPNGIDSYWIQNRLIPEASQEPQTILYVGRFDNNKNVLSLIEAIRMVRKKYPHLQLHLVGGRGDKTSAVMSLVAQNDWISYLGEIYEMESLREAYRQHDLFAMVSHSETFGLVYLEALSQGLPVIYTLGQGFDGLYTEGQVGYRAHSDQIDDIADSIEKALLHYRSLRQNIAALSLAEFEWEQIATQYEKIYLFK